MARIARVVVPHIPHHVTQRGVHRNDVFFCDDDYRLYLSLLSASCKKNNTEVWAYCLMTNHVHLIMIPSSEDGLRASLGETHRRYTLHINQQEQCRGHLWQERINRVRRKSHIVIPDLIGYPENLANNGFPPEGELRSKRNRPGVSRE